MADILPLEQKRVVTFMDVGTNSARLLLVRINPNHSYTVLTNQKEVIRLGEGEFSDEEVLQPEAMQRALDVLSRYSAAAKHYQSDEVIAVATSATREAKNQADFLKMLERECGLELRVISGKEEARLVYLGVSSGVNLADNKAMFIDIGGGSTEVAYGNQHEYDYLDMFKLGAIRLTQLYFLPGDEAVVTPSHYALIKNYVRNTAIRAINRLRAENTGICYGSSGTIMNVGEMILQRSEKRRLVRDDMVTLEQIKELAAYLCSLPLDERRKVPGINPERADIIVAGIAVLETLLTEIGVKQICISDRSLRDGLLVDYLDRMGIGAYGESISIRERSVLQLARSCHFDEKHARTVAALSDQIFTGLRDCRLINLGEPERELLRYSCLLHDIGTFLSYTNHDQHSYYLVRNTDMLGFDQTELEMMAIISKFHRKGWPKLKFPELAELDKERLTCVRQLAVILRIAESLDRTHMDVIKSVSIKPIDKKRVQLVAAANGDCQLEAWGMSNHVNSFAKAFNRILELSFEQPSEDTAKN